MKIIVPVAGRGTRLRPITNKIPKCLVKVGDKAMLGHFLDSMDYFWPGEFVFVVPAGKFGHCIRQYVKDQYPFLNSHFVTQNYPCGQIDALWQANKYMYGERVMVTFPDTLIEPFCWPMQKETRGRIYVRGVKNSKSVGLVYTDSKGKVLHIDEKPSDGRPGWAITGAIYVPDGEILAKALRDTITGLYFSETIERMLRGGMQFDVAPINCWITVDNLYSLAKARLRWAVRKELL